MNKIFRILPVLSIALVIAAVSGIASAQTNDVFWITYYSNNGTPGSPGFAIRVTNPGVQAGNRGSFTKPGPGSLCAMEYVFISDQQLTACCGCLVTPNGLQQLDGSSTLTGVTPRDGTVEIVSAALNSSASATAVFPENSPFCDPTAPYTPTPDLRIWMTHPQDKVTGGGFPITETPALPAPLSAKEEGWLQGNCNFLVIQGSGQGICDCGLFEK